MSKIIKFASMPKVFVARSIVCRVYQSFNNFRLITVTIKDGEVTKYEESPPYASFEALARMELLSKNDLLGLSQSFADGKTITKEQ